MNRKSKTEVIEKSHLRRILEGILLIVGGVFLALSLVPPTTEMLGLLGGITASGFFYSVGLMAYTLPIFFIWWGIKHIEEKPLTARQSMYLLTSFLSCTILAAEIGFHFPIIATFFHMKALGGVPFHYLYRESFYPFLGALGTLLVFGSLLFVALVLLTSFDPRTIYWRSKALLDGFLERRRLLTATPRVEKAIPAETPIISLDPPPSLMRPHPLKFPKEEKAAAPKSKPIQEPRSPLPSAPRMEGNFTLPPPSLLTQIKNDPSALKSDLMRQAAILEETLLSFGIEAKVGNISAGPTITSFEVHPAVGVKVQKIKALENDIALNMQAKSIRIVAPIPGKAAVGIELPSANPQEVGFRDLIESYIAQNKKLNIPLLLGKGVSGEEISCDLTKMPHCIIAGATGSGKSVCINTIVMSILMTASPDDIKLVMVDPKKVELTAYSKLPHMLAPVITEPKEALAALTWLVREMERRYELFRLLGIRNMLGFNTRKKDPELEASIEMEIPEKMPYIVVIIDELADLMMVSSSDIETPIARLAQMARAVGIHVILATQRPSREVITGLIKANFPTRLAFKVSSRVNSQIIIDENGAETLLGNGDMLFIPPGTASLVRAQGAYIRDEDINRVIDFILKQRSAAYLIPSFSQLSFPEMASGDDSEQDVDPLYTQAKALIFETGNASTTFLQRKLKIGYARAASLMDEMEANGIIGPADGAKPRRIFYPGEQSDL